MTNDRPDYVMKFDLGTIKHLGLQMYSTLPPVIGELVANAWDADATLVRITIPTQPLTDRSEIIVEDNGHGMSDQDIREAYLVIGRDRREVEGRDITLGGRQVMGRKGIGKLSGFGIATEIEVESVRDGEVSRFRMNLEELREAAEKREIRMPALEPTGTVTHGTKITLRHIGKYRTRSIAIPQLRRGIARRFAVVGDGFEISESVS
jgi:HSP90 family molecular chaperone